MGIIQTPRPKRQPPSMLEMGTDNPEAAALPTPIMAL